MCSFPIQRKKPAQRLFVGMAGSPLVLTATIEPAPVKAVRMRNMVLLHFCFNQQAGETKNEHCPCEERAERVTHDVAEEYVKQEWADWLIVKNGRAKTGTSIFRRALVVRSVLIDSQRLFAVSSRWKPKNSRTDKHEAIKVDIRNRAKGLLERLFSKGIIAQDVFQRMTTDAELDSLFTDQTKGEEFLAALTKQGQHRFRKQFADIILHWWNNVLGFHRLNTDAGTIMPGADQSTGAIVYIDDPDKSDAQIGSNPTINPNSHQTGEYDNNFGREVAAANHRASHWNGAWDYSVGTDPAKFEKGEIPDEENEPEDPPEGAD